MTQRFVIITMKSSCVVGHPSRGLRPAASLSADEIHDLYNQSSSKHGVYLGKGIFKAWLLVDQDETFNATGRRECRYRAGLLVGIDKVKVVAPNPGNAPGRI